MKLYNNFKLALWIILLLSVSSLLVFRYSAIAAGTSSTSDILILFFWIVLMLAPVFQDINIFRLRLKQSIESLKDQVLNLMFTVQSQTQTQSVNISNYPIPPSDNEIAQRQKEATEVLAKGVSIRSLQDDSIPQDPEINYLFNLRRSIEPELRRIESMRLGFDWDYRRFSFAQIIQRFVQADLMPRGWQLQ